MAYKIMVAVQKGGTGKSTTTSIMAEIMAAAGFRVLVMDLDSQGNTTMMLTQKSIYDYTGNTILEAIAEKNPKKYLVNIGENLDLLPAEDMMATFSRHVYTSGYADPAAVLKNAMVQIENDYDFILMDCPPNLGDTVLNACVYTDFYIIPVQCEAFGLDALDRFVQFIEEARNSGHTHSELLGMVFTMRDYRTVSEKVIADSVRRTYGDLVFKAEIKRRAKLKDFALMGITMEKKADAKALEDYISLTEEVISRIKGMEERANDEK